MGCADHHRDDIRPTATAASPPERSTPTGQHHQRRGHLAPQAASRPPPPAARAGTERAEQHHNTQMQLTWGSVTGAASYTLQYKLAGGSYASVPACTAIVGTSCTVTGLTAQSSYSFQVKAANSGRRLRLEQRDRRPQPPWPSHLGDLPDNTHAVTSSSMTITWVNPAVPGAGTITYTLQYRCPAAPTWTRQPLPPVPAPPRSAAASADWLADTAMSTGSRRQTQRGARSGAANFQPRPPGDAGSRRHHRGVDKPDRPLLVCRARSHRLHRPAGSLRKQPDAVHLPGHGKR